MIDPIEVTRDGANDAWTYRGRDSATGADAAVHLTREPCSPDSTGAKYTFRAVAEHTQIGTLNGCARIAAELFPKINNQPDDQDDVDKKPTVLPADIIKFQLPTTVAYVSPASKVVVDVAKIRKIAGPEGTELSLSHDGKRLLYTRSDSKNGPERTIVLYDFTSGHSQELVHGGVRQPFWSPDDSRVAFLKFQDQKWELFTFAAGSPEQGMPLYVNSLTSLHGWTDAHTVLASDMQNAYWISDDGRPIQTVPLKEIYGEVFDVAGSDTLRVNPINPDLLLVSAPYLKAPAGAPTDAMGLAAGFFLFELRSKRRVVLSPADQWARHAEWSRDGVQVFYTRRVSAALSTYRMLWDASTPKRYVDGSEFVVGK
jgi:WD40-like Beta Propeller Repeat